MRSRILNCVVVVLLLTLAGPARAVGVGALGDSYADEYQFYPPDRSTARNFVEILAALRGVDFGPFTTASRGEPRNQGFAFDWARSGASSSDMISAGQATGLAAQVAAGKVNDALMFVGGDDLRNAVESADPAAALQQTVPTLLSNVLLAANTILAAGPNARVVIANLPDVRVLPVVQLALSEGLLTQQQVDQIGQVIASYNQALAAQTASNSRIAIFDANAFSQSLFAQPTLTVGGVTIDRTTPADDFHHLFLADGIHIGTVGQGLLANGFINSLDTNFGAGITPLTGQEIVSYAAQIQSQSVPLPASAWMCLACVPLLAVVARRRPRIA